MMRDVVIGTVKRHSVSSLTLPLVRRVANVVLYAEDNGKRINHLFCVQKRKKKKKKVLIGKEETVGWLASITFLASIVV